MVENIFLTIWSQRTEKLIQRKILRMLDLRMSKAIFDFTFLKEGRAYRTIQAASTVHHVSRNLKLAKKNVIYNKKTSESFWPSGHLELFFLV